MLPSVRYFATERERISIPEVKFPVDNVYNTMGDTVTGEQRISRIARLKMILAHGR
jgi:hypothetical protein